MFLVCILGICFVNTDTLLNGICYISWNRMWKSHVHYLKLLFPPALIFNHFLCHDCKWLHHVNCIESGDQYFLIPVRILVFHQKRKSEHCKKVIRADVGDIWNVVHSNIVVIYFVPAYHLLTCTTSNGWSSTILWSFLCFVTYLILWSKDIKFTFYSSCFFFRV
jgi:hypothetical protein